jgi:acyl-[acyl-carrier-protein]-phospholipid O-acyltransferase / long-chain-fatty-acid--[acyl-carrier-protein] ligase
METQMSGSPVSILKSFASAPAFALVRLVLRLLFRVKVIGLDRLAAAGGRVLIVANHVSSIDALLLSAFLPGRILFAAPADVAARWWRKPYWRAAFSLDQNSPKTAKTMMEAIKAGTPCLIFPEGRQSRTGALMKVYESPGMIADKTGAEILPIRIDGPQYSLFSDAVGLRRRMLPQVTLSILPARRLDLPAEIKGHRRRQIAGAKLYDLMEETMVLGAPVSTMLRQLLASKAIRGANRPIVEDAERKPLTHNAYLTEVFTMARLLARTVGAHEKAVGVMMPNGVANAVAIFATQALDRVSAMVNYTSGPKRVVQACNMAQIETVLTLRSFVAGLHLEPVVDALKAEKIRVLYWEDAKAGGFDRLVGWVRARLPAGLAARGLSHSPDAPALLLFTSGTEGLPKGVMLSHRNVIGNGIQFAVRIGFTAGDVVFACLPMFHSFGLTLGFFLPLFAGTRTFLYPSPLRYHDIPELVYDTRATFLLGTDTFLANYARNATPHDFYFLRFAIGGAEQIKAETRKMWSEKFGVRLFEGYGTTETAPVIGCNSPLHYKAGTIGRALSGMETRLKPVDGIAGGAELIVRGLNVMLGYVKADRPGVVQPLEDGWYNTGDVVGLDEEGFVTILGRTKRFAKVGGEMVSLGAIEAVVGSFWPDTRHVAVSVPQQRRGEAVVLLTESLEVDLSRLPALFRAAGLTELSLPRKLIKVARIPLLGSGKTDYAGARAVAMDADAVGD